MATWSFRDALEELELRHQFDDSMLKSEAGLRLGDVRFAELQTTIKNVRCMTQHIPLLHRGRGVQPRPSGSPLLQPNDCHTYRLPPRLASPGH